MSVLPDGERANLAKIVPHLVPSNTIMYRASLDLLNKTLQYIVIRRERERERKKERKGILRDGYREKIIEVHIRIRNKD